MTATDAQGAIDTPLGYAGASTQRVAAENAIEYAYRNLDLLRRVVLASSAPQGAAGILPVLVANGDSDPMILPRYSHLLAGLLPDARLTVYPDSAHGFLFQHHDQFAADVHAFLEEED